MVKSLGWQALPLEHSKSCRDLSSQYSTLSSKKICGPRPIPAQILNHKTINITGSSISGLHHESLPLLYFYPTNPIPTEVLCKVLSFNDRNTTYRKLACLLTCCSQNKSLDSNNKGLQSPKTEFSRIILVASTDKFQ